MSASEAKSEFGRLLEMAIQGDAVVITKHDSPRAVLISVENFSALSGAAETKLDTLSQEFDALLARMQTSKARRGMKSAFAASGKRVGKAAVAATRSRGGRAPRPILILHISKGKILEMVDLSKTPQWGQGFGGRST